jgi:hypothetical protein
MALALALALFLTAPPVDDAAPRTYGALVKTLSSDKALASDKTAKRTALLRFAQDSRASTGDRLRAVRASLDLLARDDVNRIDAELLVARLEGVRGRGAARKSAIANLRRLAKKAKDKREPAFEAMSLADDAHAALMRALKRHRASTPLTENERALLSIDVHTGAQVAVGDAPAAARLAFVAAELAVKGVAVDEALTLLERAIALAGEARDATLVVDSALRLRARLFAKKGEIARAAEESLRADVRHVVSPVESAFFAPPERAFVRSRTTADLCFALSAAGKPNGQSCRAIEKRLKMTPTFYDFSVETSDDGFDYERGEVALSEASDHLFACVKAAAQDKSFDARRLEVEFTVLHGGRTKKLGLKPARLAGSPVDVCLDEALTRVRYPRYDGELHHVVLPFDIGR